ncbi:MAG: zeta toxin family protein [Bacteroidales bacterium]|nr:zeta toxin family protein [Bacteroidales bacterium]MDT3360867.1 zeta toxin family protein [Bacteroidota bacterium]
MPKLYIISGCNGSGKTTASYTLLPEMWECKYFVNSDEFAKGLSPFDPDKASLSAGRFMVMRIKYLLDRKEDFCIETTLSSRTLTNTIEIARQYGYSITILFFWIENVELAISRVKARVTAGGHNVPEATIRRRYRSGLRHFFEDYMPMSDRWMLADNTTVPFKLVAQGWKNNMVVQDNIKFEAIKAQAERFRKEDVSR